MPATLTRTSKASPCRSKSPATTLRRLSSSVTSSATTSAEPPEAGIVERGCSLPSALTSARATCAPASASATLVARPSPLAAPVTSATRPFSDPSTRNLQLLVITSVSGQPRGEPAAPQVGRRRSAGGRPGVGEGDGLQPAGVDELDQLVGDLADRRVVRVPDHDV